MKYLYQHILLFMLGLLLVFTASAKESYFPADPSDPILNQQQQLSQLIKEAVVKDSSNMKQVPKWIMDWLNVNGVALNDSIIVKRDEFALATFVNVYMAGILEGDEWIVKKLNELAYARDEQKNSPYLAFTVKLHNRTPGAYKITLLLEASSSIPANVVTEAKLLLNETVSGKTYSKVEDSRQDVTDAIKNVLTKVEEQVGTSLAPDFAIRYDNKLYMNGHVIKVWKEDKDIELEAVDKNKRRIDDSVVWTNASGEKGLASYSIRQAGSKEVGLKVKQAEQKVTIVVLDGKAELNELVLQILKELADKELAKWGELKDKITKSGKELDDAKSRQKTKKESISIGNHETVEIGEVIALSGEPIKTTLTNDQLTKLKADPEKKKFFEEYEKFFKFQMDLKKAIYLVHAVQFLSKEDNLKVFVSEVRNNLEDDLMNLGKDLLIGAIQGNNPDIKDKVALMVTNRITQIVEDIEKN